MNEPNPSVARYTIDGQGSRVRFAIRLVAWKVRGTFTEIEGWIGYDGDHRGSLTADASIRVASIRTGNPRRDEHLRSPDFFDAARFPVMRFVGHRATDAGDGGLRLEGDLTIRDTTQPASFAVRKLVAGRDESGRRSLGFEATSRIDRFAHGAGGRILIDKGAIVVGREAEADLRILATRDG